MSPIGLKIQVSGGLYSFMEQRPHTPGPRTSAGPGPVRNWATEQEVRDKQVSIASSIFSATPQFQHYHLSSASDDQELDLIGTQFLMLKRVGTASLKDNLFPCLFQLPGASHFPWLVVYFYVFKAISKASLSLSLALTYCFTHPHLKELCCGISFTCINQDNLLILKSAKYQH